jgi:hypothetical protein
VSVVVLSWLTAIVERSPIHSDSWGPTLAVWCAGPTIGLGLLLARRWSWAAAWILGTVLGIVGVLATVVFWVATQGH